MSWSERTTLLVIEDDPEDVELLKEMLARSRWPELDFMLVTAPTLQEGLKLLAQGGIGVLLLDLHLPDSRGLEGLKRLRACAPEVPIVVLTGLYDEALGLDAVRHGAQDYLVKGALDDRILARALGYAVERHRLRARLEAVLDSASDGMAVVDAGGLVRFSNPAAAALLEAPSEGLIGKPLPFSAVPGRTVEARLPLSGGGERFLEVRVKEMEWDDELARLVMLRDVTQPRLLERRKAALLERLSTERLSD